MTLLKEPAKKLLSLGLLATSRTRVIFMHHDLSEPDSPQYSELYSTRPKRFKEQVDYLARHFEFVELEALFGDCFGGSGKPLASLTFDDGFRSVREIALPYLSRLGIPFSVFVTGEALRENRIPYTDEYRTLNRAYDSRVYCDENDLHALDHAGVLIGNHGMTHVPLSSCDSAGLQREIAGNKLLLEQVLGKPVRHIALPYGKRSHYNDEVIRVCRQSGHRFIYSNNPTPFKAGEIHPLHDLIPRIGLTSQDEGFLRFIINRATFKKIDL